MAATPHTEELERWFRSNGGYLNQSIRILQDINSQSGIHYRAVEPISTGTTIASAPHSLALSYLSALVDDDFSVFKEQKQMFKVEAIGFFYLMTQWVNREQSFWKPYLDTLPNPEENFSQPLFFEDAEDVAWLEGTDVWHTAVARKEVYEEYYRDGIEVLKQAGVDTVPYTWRLFTWSVTILSSRSFSSRALQPGSNKFWPAFRSEHPGGPRQTVLLDMSQAPDEDLVFPVLFPGLDAANHSHDSKVDWTFDPDRFSITLAGEVKIEAGSEVFNNYGPKGNGELLLGYGFCVPGNPHDTVAMTLKPPPESLRRKIGQLHPNYLTKDSTWNTEKATFYLKRPPSQLVNPEQIFHHLPEPLLELLVYILRDERGLAFTSFDQPIEYLTSANSQGQRYLPHIARMTVQSLGPKLARLQNVHLPTEPRNHKQRQAAIYRQSQLDILSALISALRVYTRSLLWWPGTGADPPTGGPRLMTLESMLYLLRRGNDAVGADFEAGIEANTNTRDIEQLRLAGWEEDLWVLLLCYLILSPEHELGRRVRNALPEYPTVLPSELQSQLPTAHAPSTDLDAADLEQARSLIELVRTAAAACSPASVWSYTQWTPEFIARTGGRILQHESFNVAVSSCLNAGQEEEEEEEVRLCICL